MQFRWGTTYFTNRPKFTRGKNADIKLSRGAYTFAQVRNEFVVHCKVVTVPKENGWVWWHDRVSGNKNMAFWRFIGELAKPAFSPAPRYCGAWPAFVFLEDLSRSQKHHCPRCCSSWKRPNTNRRFISCKSLIPITIYPTLIRVNSTSVSEKGFRETSWRLWPDLKWTFFGMISVMRTLSLAQKVDNTWRKKLKRKIRCREWGMKYV